MRVGVLQLQTAPGLALELFAFCLGDTPVTEVSSTTHGPGLESHPSAGWSPATRNPCEYLHCLEKLPMRQMGTYVQRASPPLIRILSQWNNRCVRGCRTV